MGFSPWAVLLVLGMQEASANECGAQWMDYTRPPQLEQYEQCRRDKEATTNMSAPGAAIGIQAECWCQNNMKELVDQLHCCNDPNYNFLCQINCEKDCSSPQAATCMEKCPSMCLEWDYLHTFDGCECRSNNCAAHTLCIVEQGKNRTQSGDLEPICDDPAFEASPELQAFYACLREYPMRTNWHRHQSSRHCICKSNVKAALERHKCCTAVWGKPFCDATCASNVTCDSDQAKQCLQDCGSTCSIVYPNQVKQSCYNNCFDPQAPCAAFKSCEPVEHAELGYVCLDGTAPKSNGCCDDKYPTTSDPVFSENCPSVCDVREKYRLSHGTECQCLGCPSTVEDAEEKLKDLLFEGSVARGQDQLLSMALWLGLKYGPTDEMQELMTQRNKEIQKVIDAHDGPTDSSLSFAIRRVSKEWNDKILAAGEKEKDCQEDSSLCDDDDRKRGGRGRRMMLLVICSVLGALVLILAILVMVYLLRRNKAHRQGASGATGGGNVVVGRPVNDTTLGNDSPAKGSPVDA